MSSVLTLRTAVTSTIRTDIDLTDAPIEMLLTDALRLADHSFNALARKFDETYSGTVSDAKSNQLCMDVAQARKIYSDLLEMLHGKGQRSFRNSLSQPKE